MCPDVDIVESKEQNSIQKNFPSKMESVLCSQLMGMCEEGIQGMWSKCICFIFGFVMSILKGGFGVPLAVISVQFWILFQVILHVEPLVVLTILYLWTYQSKEKLV